MFALAFNPFPGSKLTLAPTSEPASTNMLLKQLIKAFIKQAWDDPAGPRDDINRDRLL